MKYWYRLYYGFRELILKQDSCEECLQWFPKREVIDNYCVECYYETHCECGQMLEDSYGSKGDGFCIRCR